MIRETIAYALRRLARLVQPKPKPFTPSPKWVELNRCQRTNDYDLQCPRDGVVHRDDVWVCAAHAVEWDEENRP